MKISIDNRFGGRGIFENRDISGVFCGDREVTIILKSGRYITFPFSTDGQMEKAYEDFDYKFKNYP